MTVDAPAGRDLGGRNFAPPGARNFAQHAVDRGYMAVAIRWFGESYGERLQRGGRQPGAAPSPA
jgi:hypothetical protein